MPDRLIQLRESLAAAQQRAQEAIDGVLALPDDAAADVVDAAVVEQDEAIAASERAKDAVAKREALLRARDAHTPEPIAPGAPTPAPFAVAKGQFRTEQVYHLSGEHSYLRDMLTAKETNDPQALARLHRSNEERRHEGAEYRDMSTTLLAGGDFLPPLYLASLFVDPNIASRPTADALPKLPLPAQGTAITIPALNSGVTVIERADNGAVSETDGVTATISHSVRELAGQVDIGRIEVMRSNPAMDQIIVSTLIKRYNARLDQQVLNGTGAGQQHVGIRAVTSPNTTAYTDASPTVLELLPKIYDAIQKVYTNRLEEMADTIILHPRRAAWMASNAGTSFPTFQLGGLYQASGTQAQGYANNIAGLNVVQDPQVGTLLGAGTEDEIYVLAKNDFILMEGPLYTRVFEDVGSGTGTIRYQVFAHSAFLSNRYPASLTIISGTGLIAPTF